MPSPSIGHPRLMSWLSCCHQLFVVSTFSGEDQIGYEHKRNMLQVEFIVGSIYQYENVPETVYQEFLTAPSHGRFFESNIRNKYQVRKVR